MFGRIMLLVVVGSLFQANSAYPADLPSAAISQAAATPETSSTTTERRGGVAAGPASEGSATAGGPGTDQLLKAAAARTGKSTKNLTAADVLGQPSMEDVVKASRVFEEKNQQAGGRAAQADRFNGWPPNFDHPPPVLHQSRPTNPWEAFWVWWTQLSDWQERALQGLLGIMAAVATIAVLRRLRPDRAPWAQPFKRYLVSSWAELAAFSLGVGLLGDAVLFSPEQPLVNAIGGAAFLSMGLGLRGLSVLARRSANQE